MSSPLAAIPAGTRRRLAAVLAAFAALLAVIAVLVGTKSAGGSVAGLVLCVVAAVAGTVLGLLAWGVASSVRIDEAGRRLDAEGCSCGHDHDAEELRVTDAAQCAADGHGAACAHDCESCTLAALRTQRSVSS